LVVGGTLLTPEPLRPSRQRPQTAQRLRLSSKGARHHAGRSLRASKVSAATWLWPGPRPAPDRCELRDSRPGSVKSRALLDRRSDAVGALDRFWPTRTMADREQTLRTCETPGHPRAALSSPFRASRPALDVAAAGASAGAAASAPSRRRERPRGAALNLYRKFSQTRISRAYYPHHEKNQQISPSIGISLLPQTSMQVH
jgi:hypothetical protein